MERLDDDLAEDLAEDLDTLDSLEDWDDLEAWDVWEEVWADASSEDLDGELGAALRGALHDDYLDALPEELGEALDAMFESLSPGEAFNLGKALQQIERGASQVLSNPAVAQIARTALPLAGGAVGTLIGGPAGTAIGSALGNAAVKALPAARTVAPVARQAVPLTPVAPTAVATTATTAPLVPAPAPVALATGSPAATQAFILSQHPDVLRGLLAASLGDRGRNEINGVPVGAMLGMLSSIFGQAATEADEMFDGDGEDHEAWQGSPRHPMADPSSPADRARSLYACLVDDESVLLAEAYR